MRHIVLVSCGKGKAKSRTKAENLYTGDLFRKSLAYARSLSPDAIYILSAKHGLLSLSDEIEPYNETLLGKSKEQRQAWSKKMLDALSRVCDFKDDRFTVLAGQKYNEFLSPQFCKCHLPLRGLRQGKQLQYLKRQLS